MNYSWDDIKKTVESIETEKAFSAIHDQTYKDENEGSFINKINLVSLGGICIGVSSSIFSFIFIYLIFVWLLHIEF